MTGPVTTVYLGIEINNSITLLDRNLSTSVLEYLLNNRRPKLNKQRKVSMTSGLEEYTRSNWNIMDAPNCPEQFDAVFETNNDSPIGIQVIHPLSARPTLAELNRLREETYIFPRVYTSFDLLRRPFWVANDLFSSSRR